MSEYETDKDVAERGFGLLGPDGWIAPKPFTPAEEAAAIGIAQSGADGVLEQLREFGLVGPAVRAYVVAFGNAPDGRIVAKLQWVSGAEAPPTSAN